MNKKLYSTIPFFVMIDTEADSIEILQRLAWKHMKIIKHL